MGKELPAEVDGRMAVGGWVVECCSYPLGEETGATLCGKVPASALLWSF